MARGTTRPSPAALILRYWLPLLAYIATIFTVSAQPYLQPPLHFQNSDKIMHLLEYGGLGLLLFRLVHRQGSIQRKDVAALVVLLAGMAIGAADETFQRFVPGRQSSVLDWLADSLGIGLAQVIGLAWTEMRGN